MNYKTITFLLIMISVNIILSFAHNAMIAEDSNIVYVNTEDSPLNDYENLESNPSGDSLGDVRTAVKERPSVWKTVLSVFIQPVGFMNEVGIPSPIVVAFGFIWYITFIYLLIQFIVPFVGDGGGY